MAINFRTAKQSFTKQDIVEILVDGKVAGVIYPSGEKGIKIVSAHISGTSTEDGFAGEVAEDDGTESFPPIPAVLISFNPSPYEIKGGRIVRPPKQRR